MGEWHVALLGDLTINHDSKRKPVKESERNPGAYPYYGASGIVDYVDDYIFDGEYLLIAEDGENLRTRQTPVAFMARGKSWVNNHAHVVTGNEKADTRFLMYAIEGMDIGAYLTGAVMPKLTQRNLNKIELLCPPLPEQRAIAHILGTLDDKIELNRRQSQTLQEMARALFKAWFVDFEPVRAKQQGRWQRGQSLHGLPAHLWDLFPERLVETESGEVPQGWEWASLSEYSSLNPESWTKRTRPKKIFYVDLSNTKWGRIENITEYESADAPSRAQRILRPLDTIVGTVRPGNGSYALVCDECLTGSTGFAVLRPLRREYSEFVYLAATARENIERLSNLADGGAYPAVRPEIVSATQVPRTGEELINEFSCQVASMLAGIADKERTSRTLAQLRDTLLPKLISGKLRVAEAERFLARTGASDCAEEMET